MRLIRKIAVFALVLSVPAQAAGRGQRAASTAKAPSRAVVYYDNDVHCHVDGYPVVAAAVRAEKNRGRCGVILVSCGDFVQGASLGAASRGGSIVDMMNAAGYDFVTLGNHEFDYGMERLGEISAALDADIVDCNLFDLRSGAPQMMYEPYRIVECGGHSIALIGISTPYSFVSSTPSFFQDGDGNFVYSLGADGIYDIVQHCIDMARAEGADFVVVLSHLGDDLDADPINSHELISGTSGIDVVLDGHAHHLIAGEIRPDRSGHPVLLTSTGSYLENVGRLEISRRGRISTRIIPLARLERRTGRDPLVQKVVDDAMRDYMALGSRTVGCSEAALPCSDGESSRMSRRRESGLGDFCADAIRMGTGADIALIGGGSIRSGLPEGELTFNDIYTMFPFGNTAAVCSMSGKRIADLLEYSAMALPTEFGGFMQVSGIRFKVDVRIPSPVILDPNRAFAGFSGPQRRVREIEVAGSDGIWTPVDPERSYAVAGSAYTLIEGGDGYGLLLEGCDVSDTGILDLDIIEDYISGRLGGIVPAAYSAPAGRIEIEY